MFPLRMPHCKTPYGMGQEPIQIKKHHNLTQSNTRTVAVQIRQRAYWMQWLALYRFSIIWQNGSILAVSSLHKSIHRWVMTLCCTGVCCFWPLEMSVRSNIVFSAQNQFPPNVKRCCTNRFCTVCYWDPHDPLLASQCFANIYRCAENIIFFFKDDCFVSCLLFQWFKFQSGPYDVDVEVEAKKGSKTFSLPVRTLRESGPMQLMFMHGDTHNTGWGEFAVSSQVKSLKKKKKNHELEFKP